MKKLLYAGPDYSHLQDAFHQDVKAYSLYLRLAGIPAEGKRIEHADLSMSLAISRFNARSHVTQRLFGANLWQYELKERGATFFLARTISSEPTLNLFES